MAEPVNDAPIRSLEAARGLLDGCGLHGLLGLEVIEFGNGHVRFVFAPPALSRDPRSGAVHGGALATALDTVAGFAMTSSTGFDIATIDLRVDYLRPAVDAEFASVGRTVRTGSRFGVAESELATLDGRVVAIARGTFTW